MIQKRVLGALLMREIITRYGRNNIGFLWLFVEPLLMTLLIVMMWKFFRVDRVSALNIVAFVITGYPMAMMWRNASSRAIGAIASNTSLLYHRNVRVLDTITARVLLEVAGATIAQVMTVAPRSSAMDTGTKALPCSASRSTNSGFTISSSTSSPSVIWGSTPP